MGRKKSVSVDVTQLAARIHRVRGLNVILDSDLASLYCVTSKRFKSRYARSQIATSKAGRGGRRNFPQAFTEHGAIMAAGVLNSTAAIDVSIYVVRAFVAMRAALAGHEEIGKRLDELESRLERKRATHDRAIAEILSAIRGLMNPPAPPRRPIGFS